MRDGGWGGEVRTDESNSTSSDFACVLSSDCIGGWCVTFAKPSDTPPATWRTGEAASRNSGFSSSSRSSSASHRS